MRTTPPTAGHPRHLARRKAGSVAEMPAAAEPSDARTDAIRVLAFAFYEARGGETGHELDDWLRAEAEVNGGSATPVNH